MSVDGAVEELWRCAETVITKLGVGLIPEKTSAINCEMRRKIRPSELQGELNEDDTIPWV